MASERVVLKRNEPRPSGDGEAGGLRLIRDRAIELGASSTSTEEASVEMEAEESKGREYYFTGVRLREE